MFCHPPSWLQRQSSLQTGGNQDCSIGIDNHTFDVGQRLDERHAPLRAQHKHPRIQSIGPHTFFRNDRHTLAQPRRLERARIQDVMIDHAIPLEVSFIVTRG